MGARQVLRVVAVLVAGLCSIAEAGEPVAVIDLRAADPEALRASRAELRGKLAAEGLTVLDAPGLDAALAGEESDLDAAEAVAALDQARAAYGLLDCAATIAAADRAIELLAARQAAGLQELVSLRSGWALVLLCADQTGDRSRAQTAAERLRALGVTRGDQVAIGDATWDRYPEIDASTDRSIDPLTVTTEPAGAAVWIDHVKVGVAPLTVYLPAGEHLVAAADGARRTATRVTLAGKPASATIALVDRSGSHAAAQQLVSGWRGGSLEPTAESLGSLMTLLEVRFAVVLTATATAQVWAMGPGETEARNIDAAGFEDVAAIAAMIADRVAAWDGRAPDPDYELLRETPGERRGLPETKWWVYAAIVGAAVLGTTILVLHDNVEDRQRIEITFP
jgi:hypothetical protein